MFGICVIGCLVIMFTDLGAVEIVTNIPSCELRTFQISDCNVHSPSTRKLQKINYWIM